MKKSAAEAAPAKERKIRVPLGELRAGERRLDGEPSHYLSRVHRLGPGDPFTAFDPETAREADAVVLRARKDALDCRFDEPRPAKTLVDAGVTLVVCTTKGSKVDDVVRAATALGVSRVIVADSERSVAGAGAVSDKRASRWRAVAVDAARQSGRGDLPAIEGPTPLGTLFLALSSASAQKIALSPQATTPLANELEQRGPRDLVLLIGPEGGLSAAELERAETSGFKLVRFGELVLRAELAAVAVLGAVLAQSGMQKPEMQ
jgi:16S rRNA (uracil1498-N3)-methyltransferase